MRQWPLAFSEKLFRALDVEEGGAVEGRELLVSLSALCHSGLMERLKLVFEAYDTDGNGLLQVHGDDANSSTHLRPWRAQRARTPTHAPRGAERRHDLYVTSSPTVTLLLQVRDLLALSVALCKLQLLATAAANGRRSARNANSTALASSGERTAWPSLVTAW